MCQHINIDVNRIYNDECLFGILSVDGKNVCATMEQNTDKPNIIPVGIYRGILYYSPKFQKLVIRIETATYPEPCYEIHSANYPRQLDGCIAVGSEICMDDACIYGSEESYQKMIQPIIDAMRDYSTVSITIRESFTVPGNPAV